MMLCTAQNHFTTNQSLRSPSNLQVHEFLAEQRLHDFALEENCEALVHPEMLLWLRVDESVVK